MSLRDRTLRSLLQLFFASKSQRTSLLRQDIRKDIKKASGTIGTDGLDFFVPFWADCKTHIAGEGDLHQLTAARIAAHHGRARLYNLLKDAFLFVLNERLSWQNEPVTMVPERVSGQFEIEDIGARVRVENLIYARTSAGIDRIVYPYFSEEPALPLKGARLGLWAMTQAFPALPSDEFRIFDILRRTYFSINGTGLTGNERQDFIDIYVELSNERDRLLNEYL